MNETQKSHRVIAWEKLAKAMDWEPKIEITDDRCKFWAETHLAIHHNFQGAKFAAVRKMVRLTQPQLAEKSGVSVDTIQRIETNEKHDPFLSNLNKICAVYGLTYPEFTIL